MKEYTTIHDIQQLLENIFKDLNVVFYNDTLAPTLITIMKSRHGKELGWATSRKVWHQKESSENNELTSYYEINICADALYLSILDIAEIMLHEMAHIYNSQNDIKDTSRSGTYHNKHFAEIANKHGLICDTTPTPKNGFGVTKLNEQATNFIKHMHYGEINLVRNNNYTHNGGYIRYVCPSCYAIVRSTKPVHILCIKCNIPFVYEETRSKKHKNKRSI